MSGGASIAGKIIVQVDAKRDARSFWWGGRVVGFAGLTKPNYKPTTGGKCIETLGPNRPQSHPSRASEHRIIPTLPGNLLIFLCVQSGIGTSVNPELIEL